MVRYRVLPYRQGSKSAKALATALGGKVLKLENSKFKTKPSDVIINWGNTSTGYAYDCTVMNNSDLKAASNKLKFFELMKQHDLTDIIPEFWTNKEDIPDEAFPVVCRTVLAGHSGDGIVIADSRDDLVVAPLYTKYIKKKDEYRIHVGVKNNEPIIISVQRKAKRNGVENPNWQVRNLAGGFVFVRDGVNPPEAVTLAATSALAATGLDFGAVDVIWNEKLEKAFVLEVNTAPGLEGQTVDDYANFFRN